MGISGEISGRLLRGAAGVGAGFRRAGRAFADALIGAHRRAVPGLRQAVTSTAAAFAAYFPTHLMGLPQAFWSAITAIAVAQAEFQATRNTAKRQVAGVIIGGTVALCLVLTSGEGLAIYAAAIVLSVLAAWLLNLADAAQLAGITATIILLVPHTGTPQQMLFSRLTEVIWGVCAGLAIVWAEGRVTKFRK